MIIITTHQLSSQCKFNLISYVIYLLPFVTTIDTLVHWTFKEFPIVFIFRYSDLEKVPERKVLEQGLKVTNMPTVTSDPLPHHLDRPGHIRPDMLTGQEYTFPEVPNTAGQGPPKRARRRLAIEETVNPPGPSNPPTGPTATIGSAEEEALIPLPLRVPYSTAHYVQKAEEGKGAGQGVQSPIHHYKDHPRL